MGSTYEIECGHPAMMRLVYNTMQSMRRLHAEALVTASLSAASVAAILPAADDVAMWHFRRPQSDNCNVSDLWGQAQYDRCCRQFAMQCTMYGQLAGYFAHDLSTAA